MLSRNDYVWAIEKDYGNLYADRQFKGC